MGRRQDRAAPGRHRLEDALPGEGLADDGLADLLNCPVPQPVRECDALVPLDREALEPRVKLAPMRATLVIRGGLEVPVVKDRMDGRLAAGELEGPGRELGARLLVTSACGVQSQVSDDLAVSHEVHQQWSGLH